MPPSAPVPLTAHFVVDLTVQFDRALTPGVIFPGNWTWRVNNVGYRGQAPATAAGDTVTVTTQVLGPDFGPDVCAYGAAPPDVISAAGIPAAAFVAFPVT